MSRRSSNRKNYGLELTINEWKLRWQGLLVQLLISAPIGFLIALTFWFLLLPKGSLESLGKLIYTRSYCYLIPFGCNAVDQANIQMLEYETQPLMRVTWLSLFAFLFMTTGTMFALNYYFRDKGEKEYSDQHIRGARLLSVAGLNAEIIESYPQRQDDLYLGEDAVRVPEILTYRHFGIAGASGTGKTQLISGMLQQLRGYGHKVLIVDLNGQFYSRFGRPGDKVLSLYDKRSQYWDFWNESASAEFFAEALIEQSINDKFFGPAGRSLLADLINTNKTIEGLWKDLTSVPKELSKKFQGGLTPVLLAAPEQAAGVLASASLQLGFLRSLNHWNQSGKPFSITRWCTEEESNDWVFLIVRDQDLSACKPLLRLWFDLAVHGTLQRDETKEYPHLWLVVDEMPGLGKLPSLGKLLSQGRKYKASTVCGYQAAGQIADLYGKDGAKEIFQGLQNKVILRCGDPDTAAQASRELGSQDVEMLNQGTTFGTENTSDRWSYNRQLKTQPVVMDAEIQNLPDGQFYLKICQFNPSLVQMRFRSWPPVQQATDCEIPPLGLPSIQNLKHAQLDQGSAPLESSPVAELENANQEEQNNFLRF